MRTLVISLGLVSLSSCSFFNNKDDKGKQIARVYDEILYEEDLRAVMPSGMSPDDSAQWVQKYVNNWGKEQLIIKKAEFNLADREKDFDELVEQYRSDLLKFTYQQRYVDEHLDTAISEVEIVEYYDQNPKEFELKENILKVKYIVLNTDAPDLAQAKRWFRSSDEDDMEDLQDYAFRYAQRSSFDDTSWVRYRDLAKFIPLTTYNEQRFLQTNRFVDLEDSMGIYMVHIQDYKIADDVSPLPYVKNTIRNIILNKRKQELIASMEERIVNDAYDKRDFEIFED